MLKNWVILIRLLHLRVFLIILLLMFREKLIIFRFLGLMLWLINNLNVGLYRLILILVIRLIVKCWHLLYHLCLIMLLPLGLILLLIHPLINHQRFFLIIIWCRTNSSWYSMKKPTVLHYNNTYLKI